MNYFRFFKYFYVLLSLAIFSNSSLGLDIQVNGIYGYDLNSTPSVVKQSGVKHEKDIYDVGCNFTHCGVEQLFKFQSEKTQTGSFFALEVGLLAPKGAGNKVDDVIHVTKDGVALPPGAKHKIPDNYVQNPHRKGNYGEIVDGKFKERLRIDPATPSGQKGPNYSHYHKNGKGRHYSPRKGDSDPGF